MEENMLIFFVVYKNKEQVLEFSEYDTVEMLKREIHDHFDIPPHKQLISGWNIIPEADNTILQMCVDAHNITRLFIVEANCLFDDSGIRNLAGMELCAAISFINKVRSDEPESSPEFHISTLKDAMSTACLTSLRERKILLLYLHNEEDQFSSIFWKNFRRSEVRTILDHSFYLLGWDVTEPTYHSALHKALNEHDLSSAVNLIDHRISAAMCIVPIKESLTIFSCLRGKVSDKDFLVALRNAQDFLNAENNEEEALKQLEDKTSKENDIGSESYQKLMADMLGDRDYDSFEHDQEKLLKDKIAFALFGPPVKEDGYEQKDMKTVEKLYMTILKSNNEIAEFKDHVEISFIYNCTEPLPKVKLHRAKKFDDYNPNTDLMPLPIFVLRKCHGSDNPCRIFIDHTGRTYQTWQEYTTRNKLHQCTMVLPKNGRYEVDEDEKVLLEYHLSPACGMDAKLLQAGDILSTAGGLVSGGIFLAAAVPAITVAPAALIAGGVVGVGVGIYAIGRSAYTLYDRRRHRETLSFVNSEARGAYVNIIAGSLGFVGAGANVLVTQLVARGVNIGRGAGAVFNTIGIVNIGAGGVSIINSGYDVIDQWISENQRPSLLSVVQLSSSVLFFGNAVYNFKTCSTFVEEIQTRTLQDYQETLRSNRHRKSFNKMMKETIRQNNGNEARGRAEVIAAIRNIPNRDEVFAVLTRTKSEMNKKGIRFAAEGGEIKLNGISIDMDNFAARNKKDTSSFLSNLLKGNVEVTPAETKSMINTLTSNQISMPDMQTIGIYAAQLLKCFSGDVKSQIISVLASLLSELSSSIMRWLDEMFPNHSQYFRLFDMVIGFFRNMAEELEEQYSKWQKTGDEKYYSKTFEYVDLKKTDIALRFFEAAVAVYYNKTYMFENSVKKLLEWFHCWLTAQWCEFQGNAERNNKKRMHSASSPTRKVFCRVCGGYYYENATYTNK